MREARHALSAFIDKWKRLRGCRFIAVVDVWNNGNAATLYCPERNPCYVLLVREEGAYSCYEHEAGLVSRPRLKRKFLHTVREYQNKLSCLSVKE